MIFYKSLKCSRLAKLWVLNVFFRTLCMKKFQTKSEKVRRKIWSILGLGSHFRNFLPTKFPQTIIFWKGMGMASILLPLNQDPYTIIKPLFGSVQNYIYLPILNNPCKPSIIKRLSATNGKKGQKCQLVLSNYHFSAWSTFPQHGAWVGMEQGAWKLRWRSELCTVFCRE